MLSFTRAALLSLAVTAGTVPVALADDGHPAAGANRNGIYQAHYDNHAGREYRGGSETVSVRFERTVRNDTLPLRRLLRLDDRYRGYTVDKVVIDLRPDHKTRQMALLTDGYVVDSENARSRNRVVLDASDEGKIGRDFTRLQLAVKGRADIERISVRLSPPRNRHYGRDAYPHKTEHHGATGGRANLEIGNAGEDLAVEIARIILQQAVYR